MRGIIEMINLRLNVRDDRQFKSLTGLSEEKFEKLCPIFCEVYEEALEEAHVQDIFHDRRKNERGGGRKGKLPTIWTLDNRSPYQLLKIFKAVLFFKF